MRTTVFFSGGLDSTYLCWWLLTNTTDEVRGFYATFAPDNEDEVSRSVLNMPTRAAQGPERVGAQRVADWLSTNVRPMELVDAAVPALASDENGHVALARLGAKEILEGRADRVAGAWTWDNWGQPCGGLARLPSYYAARRAFNVAMGKPMSVEVDSRLWMPLLDDEVNPRHGHVHAVAHLPRALLDLTVSCKNPVFDADGLPARCWACRRCQWFTRVKQMLSMGMKPDEIQSYRLLRSTAPDGTYVNARFWLQDELDGKWPDHTFGLRTIRSGCHWSSKPFPDSGIWKGLHGTWASPVALIGQATTPEGG